MANINIPFKVQETPYTNEQTKAKDAATLEALQEIAQALSSINASLQELAVSCSSSNTK